MDMEKILTVDEEEEFPAIARLIELGRQKSYVTLDDILHFFPEAEQDVEQLEEAFSALLSAGIPFMEDTITSEPTEDELVAVEETETEVEIDTSLDDYLANIDTDDTIGLYLKEVSRVPLLTATEEVELAQRIERGRMAREELARGSSTPKRRLELRKLIEDGWAAREHLITANSRLVISVAKKYMGRGVPFLDLIQEGNIGLIRATKKFDYLRHLVDPPGRDACHRRPGTHHPRARPHGRPDQQTPARPAPVDAASRPRTLGGGTGERSGSATQEGREHDPGGTPSALA
jgi:RNA polymerase primary sigma factor